MADSNQGFSDTQKFCFDYYERNVCKKPGCSLTHKRKNHIDVVQVKPRDGCVIGRLKTAPLCRYFLRGYCTHAGNCRFRHEIIPVNMRNVPNTNSNQPSSTNTPSTSATELQNANKSEDKRASRAESSVHASAASNMNNGKPGEAAVNNAEGAACSPLKDSLWVNAPEFVPKSIATKPLSYAAAVNPTGAVGNNNSTKQLCPYANKDGFCKYPPGECSYLHGEICDLCGNAALHPYDEELRKKHRQDCIKQHEKNMELSFAIARSKEKSCGICFEVIMEKANGEQRFGILPNCNHCFCLSCIRKWRQARQFENKIIRACPECRVTSDFVCPSLFWVDTKEDKNKLIDDYKTALSTKDCKYFDKGVGKCPFGNKCFYRHAFPDGRVCDVGPPPRQRRRGPGLDNAAIEVLQVRAEFIHLYRIIEFNLQQVILWDFLDERDNPWQSLAEDLEDLADFFSDSEESDWSDYDLFIS
ncbi:putative E3 ubiquitin-protein ligase makorin-1-like Protein [Tribolium castaneum]|uniref:RING-type E3 ubiquitin transferase n=1 Tax=Tribolium castaneum TaxID=7070 RepID=A0A139WP96_TRICA|nr:putative E3 ubiquitin-protein ligase makorin-1-like Protein [Tribolium castaneum]